YNDRFGHPAGDVLLRRLAAKLAAVVEHAGGLAFRMGGDEFCVLVPVAEAKTTLEQCAIALSEYGEGFVVTASMGAVDLGDEAHSASEALRLADQRLYASKNSRRLAPGFQAREVLVRLIAEREHEL